MKLPTNRNDRALFGTVGAMVGAALLVGVGTAAAVDFKVEVPGKYVLVDHALSRAARGLVGTLVVEGPEQPDLFRENGEEVVGMHTK